MKSIEKHGRKIEIFEAWGEGVPVGINLTRTPEAAARYSDPSTFFMFDLTSKEARELSYELANLADRADEMERSFDEYAQNQIAQQSEIEIHPEVMNERIQTTRVEGESEGTMSVGGGDETRGAAICGESQQVLFGSKTDTETN